MTIASPLRVGQRWCGADPLFAVGAGAPGEPVAGESGAAVAQRPRRRLGVDRGELVLGQHPMSREEVEDAEIEIGERRGLRLGTRTSAARASA